MVLLIGIVVSMADFLALAQLIFASDVLFEEAPPVLRRCLEVFMGASALVRIMPGTTLFREEVPLLDPITSLAI